MKRLPDWRARLDKMFDEIRRTPFDWATGHDCALALASGAIRALTGVDVAAPYRGKYSNEIGAIKLLKQHGFDNLEALAASLLPEIPVSRAHLGDIVTYLDETVPSSDPLAYTFGVVNGERAFVLRPEGIGTMDLLKASRAFRVG